MSESLLLDTVQTSIMVLGGLWLYLGFPRVSPEAWNPMRPRLLWVFMIPAGMCFTVGVGVFVFGAIQGGTVVGWAARFAGSLMMVTSIVYGALGAIAAAEEIRGEQDE